MVSKRTSKWLWNGISNYHIAKSSFSLYYTPSSPIRACEQVDKQVRTKMPYWIYREFPRGSRIGKSSPVPLGCPSVRYYLGSHFLDPLFWSFNMALFASKNIRAPEENASLCTDVPPPIDFFWGRGDVCTQAKKTPVLQATIYTAVPRCTFVKSVRILKIENWVFCTLSLC